MTDRYGVIGHPIGHSKSPVIHRLFAAQTGQDISYEPFDLAPEELERRRAEFARGKVLAQSLRDASLGG